MKKLLVLAIVVVMLSSLVLTACSKDEKVTLDGTAKGFKGDIEVKVTLEGNKIVDVEIVKHEETPGISDPAFEEIPAAIISKGSVDGIDAVSSATGTSNGIIDAVKDALSKKK